VAKSNWRPANDVALSRSECGVVGVDVRTGNEFDIGQRPFPKRQRVLSPDQYLIVDVRTSHGVRRVMLFSKAILQAEWDAEAPVREVMAIKRARREVKRAARAASMRDKQ
jgi:hypothetical protein